MKLGMIVRADNSGLGTMSWEYSRHLRPDKVLIVSNGVYQMFPERYSEFPSRRGIDNADWLLDGIDTLLAIETFYDWSLVAKAKERGIKTVLIPMIEMTRERIQAVPDVFLSPSKLDYEYFSKRYQNQNHYLPVPVALDRLPVQKRKHANVFIHVGSHGGVNMRKGTPLVIEAMKYVQSDIKLILYTWGDFQSDDSRIEVRRTNFKNYWQLYREGDALIYPQDYNGICLPIIEAMASGMGVVTTSIYPFNEYFPKSLMFEPTQLVKKRASPGLVEMDAAIIDPKSIAQVIDTAHKNGIAEESLYGILWGKENSWDRLTKKYLDVLAQ